MSGSRAKYSPGPSDCPCWPRRAGGRGDGVHVAVSGAVEHDLHLERRVAPACGDEGGVQRGASSVEGVDANRNAVLLPLLVVDTLGRR